MAREKEPGPREKQRYRAVRYAFGVVLVLPVVAVLSGALFNCAGTQPPAKPQQQAEQKEVSLLERSAPKTSGELTFPPADNGSRRSRAELPPLLGGSAGPLTVTHPWTGSGGRFELSGKVLSFGLDRPVAGAKAGAAAGGLIHLEPAVAGLATWQDERTLQFVAEKPFDPNQWYAVELRGIKGALGGELLGGKWQGKFQATPGIFVAGKELSHIPEPGQPRPVATHPRDSAHVGRQPYMWVLFDQPIELGRARALIELMGRSHEQVPIAVSHPAADRLDGYKVDRRQVVLVQPRRQLGYGEGLTLTVKRPTGLQLTRTFTVADRLIHTSIECGYYQSDTEVCRLEGSQLTTTGNTVHVLFNERIGTADNLLKWRVNITPKVPNLTVQNDGWSEGRLVLSGAFRSSTTYKVSIDSLVDVFGNRLQRPVHFTVATMPLGAHVTMPEGLITLDEAATKGFELKSRNVAQAEIVAWPVPDGDAGAFRRALQQTRDQELPAESSTAVRLAVPIKARQDQLVVTAVDLSAKLQSGQSYLVTVAAQKLAFGAEPTKFPADSPASRPPVALLRPVSPKSLAVHAHRTLGATVVHVARLKGGEAVAGAQVSLIAGQTPAGRPVATDAGGTAVLRGQADNDTLLEVVADKEKLLLPLAAGRATAAALFPDLSSGVPATPADQRALVITDRGIYRPGADIGVKAWVYKPRGATLSPAQGAAVRLRLLGPTGDQVFVNSRASTDDHGGVALRIALPAQAKIGRHQLLLEDPAQPEPPLGRTIVQVAEFEPPRFAVDVKAEIEGHGTPELRAAVQGRYLFGAPMDGAAVSWTVRRSAASFPEGPLVDGLRFRPELSWFDEEEADGGRPAWTATGEGLLSDAGTLTVNSALSLEGAVGPQRFVLEADVTDSSYRHITGRGVATYHPQRRYAGLKAPRGWVDVGQTIPVELGVIDTEGQAVTGAQATAKLYRVDWRYQQQRGAAGGISARWTKIRSEVGRCSVTSRATAQACSLSVSRSGDYEVAAEVDGNQGGVVSFWAWRTGDTAQIPAPSRGPVVELTSDKERYAPGQTARLLVRNPYPAATAILTTETGGLLSHETKQIRAAAAVFDVPVTAAMAPHVHATVTLLPTSQKDRSGPAYRIGALRLPVSAKDARLDVTVAADRSAYEPGDKATLSVVCKDGARPRPNADVALAVVDEGVLRLTGFTAADPVPALRPGRPLGFDLADSRDGLGELYERSHVAGGGGGDNGGEMGTVARTRQSFVKTALWEPSLRTDAEGKVTVTLKLPDNLTQFRIMAVVVDAEGKGAAAESHFVVQKPVMLSPALPRFALVGDQLEAAAMVHNNTDAPFEGTVRLAERVADVRIPARGRTRVGFPLLVKDPGSLKLTMWVEDQAARQLDKVEQQIPVSLPGTEVRPRLDGAFVKQQTIALRIGDNVMAPAHQTVSVRVGEQLWPEIGARLEYLLGYPHGCVEQTTSSTLPLIAAKDILPRIGLASLSDKELRQRIAAGITRLSQMRTPEGGLAYWPGGSEPNVYGTAYAIRAVILAEKAGVKAPAGMLAGMTGYLRNRLHLRAVEPEVRAAIAQSLAEQGKLPDFSADSLFDLQKEISVFGIASLALALAHQKGQEDRVSQLLDQLEASFDANGKLRSPAKSDDFHYFGSDTRTKAQAAMALNRLRRGSKLLPVLLRELGESLDDYTTQATAYSLLAIADQLKQQAAAGLKVSVTLNGKALVAKRDLGHGSELYEIPLEDLRGKPGTLRLVSDSGRAVGFMVSAAYRVPFAAAAQKGALAISLPRTAESAAAGPDIYRLMTDPEGRPVDLGQIRAGDLLRVTLLVRLQNDSNPRRHSYLAVSDRLAAGFEPVQTDLATVSSGPELTSSHPWYELLAYRQNQVSHLELRDDRVMIYFDQIWGREAVATYLVRATTPGEFALPPASAELMYQADSLSYSEAGKVVINQPASQAI